MHFFHLNEYISFHMFILSSEVNNMKKINIALIAGLLLAIIFSDFISFRKSYDELQQNVLRMHIIANSDSVDDQQLKLKVRDELLSHSDEIFSDCYNISDAENNIKNKFELIEKIANDTIRKNGFSYHAKAELVNMEFAAKVYNDITMPAGTYDALRITIGNAEGHNWWCVMYPPLCLPVEGVAEEYFDDGEQDILYNPDKYEIKFKCLEIFEKLNEKIPE
ncbi:MAG TPA: stage II sporulation protein R [Ruminococcus sp.]|nr:stage II sporulation protein R [Ruminococcus sp.]